MKTIGAENQNTEYGRIPDIRQNTPEHGRRPLYWVALLVIAWSGLLGELTLNMQYASAQAPTITPLPGPVATATAAAQQMTQAQQSKAQAAQQAAQAQQQAAAADAQFNAAQQAANEARAALAAQQIAAASEALGRAEAAITDGKAKIGDVLSQVDGLKATINQQADRIVALSAETQQARIEKQQADVTSQNFSAAYTALQTRFDEQQSKFSISPTIVIIAAGFLVAIVLIFIAWKWSRRESAPTDPPAAPPIDGEWQDVTNEEQHESAA